MVKRLVLGSLAGGALLLATAPAASAWTVTNYTRTSTLNRSTVATRNCVNQQPCTVTHTTTAP